MSLQSFADILNDATRRPLSLVTRVAEAAVICYGAGMASDKIYDMVIEKLGAQSSADAKAAIKLGLQSLLVNYV